MKDKPSEWIAISDLMAGVMAVVMLLLVISVVQKQEMARLAHANDPRQEKLDQLLGELSASLSETSDQNMVALDATAKKITLRDGVFNRGSACMATASQPALENIRQKISGFLHSIPEGQIFVEGHTDDRPVTRPVTDFSAYCTVYDDNYTLSAARAREARKLLASDLQVTDAKRIVVAGFGDSQPLVGIAPDDARQRRVEIRFVIRDVK